jgi:hypothetical protein
MGFSNSWLNYPKFKPESRRQVMRYYKPSGIAPLAGIIITSLFGVIAAIIAGGILFAIDHYAKYSVVVVFSACAGAFVGFSISKGVHFGKIRNTRVVISIAAFSMIVTLGLHQLLNYQIGLKDDLRTALATSLAPTPTYSYKRSTNPDPAIREAEDAANQMLAKAGYQMSHDNAPAIDTSSITDSAVEAAEKSMLHGTGFWGFLNYQAQNGVTLTSTHDYSRNGRGGFQIVGVWVWMLFALEFLAALFFAGIMGYLAVQNPFDEASNAWFKSPIRVLSGDWEAAGNVLHALQTGDYERAGQNLRSTFRPAPRIDLLARSTVDGNPESIVLLINRVGIENFREKNEKLDQGMVTQDELTRIMTASTSLRTSADHQAKD